METIFAKFLVIRNTMNGKLVSFTGVDRLTVQNTIGIREILMDMVTKRGSELEIDLSAIRFIDSHMMDTLNLLSRMSRRYGSRVVLTHVTPEVWEFIQLVKLHSVFDINKVYKEERIDPAA
ncbi:MAG: STAS domain-containing protein [Bacteroidota bacterium]|nr:MAG: STAS domain-containing protein [Bacteroidota bacterium]